MAKSWPIGSSLITAMDGEVSLLYKTYPITSATVPSQAQWLLTRKPAITLVGTGQIWVRFKKDTRNASCLLKFQVSSDFKSLEFTGGRYYSHLDKNLVLVRDSLDF